MENKNEGRKTIKMLVLAGQSGSEMLEWLKNESETIFDSVDTPYDCFIKLQNGQYDGLVVDTTHLMIGNKVNTHLIRMINELVPVIVISNGEKPEIENIIRAEKIFYYLVNPTYDGELKQAILQAARWKKAAREKGPEANKRKPEGGAQKFLGICLMALLLFGSRCEADDITVSVSALRNLTGNPCNDWIGAGFANSLVTSIKELPGIKVIEEAEMDKLLEAIKFGLSGFVDEKTIIEKGRVIGVHYSVVGSVQLFDDKAVICYRLVNMQTGEVMFSNTIKGKLRNILGLEDAANADIVKHFENKFPAICLKPGSRKRSNFAIIHGDGSQGLKYSLMVDLDEAEKCYEAAITENPEYADGYLGLGEIYMQKKEYAAALSRFNKAFTLYDAYKDRYFSGCAAYKAGEAYYQQSDYDSAEAYFNIALRYKKDQPKDFQVLYIYGRLSEIAELRDENAKMADYLKKALKVSKKLKDTPSQVEFLTQLSKYYESNADHKTALKYASKASELSGEGGAGKPFMKEQVAVNNSKLQKRMIAVKERAKRISERTAASNTCELSGDNNIDGSALEKEQANKTSLKLQKRMTAVKERAKRLTERQYEGNIKLVKVE